MIKDSIILTFSKGIRGILMLIFNMIIARVFSESLYGTYKHINLVVNLLTSIFILGVPTTISYYYSTYDEIRKSRLIGNTISILMCMATISSIGVILFKEQLVRVLNNPNLIYYINILAIYVFIMIISSFLENLYISSDKAVLLGKIYIVYVLLNFICMIISIVVFKSLYLLVVVTVIIEIIRTIIMYVWVRNIDKLKLCIDKTMMVSQLKFAIPLGVVSIVQTINTYIDNIFIASNYPPDQYASYANAAMDIPFVGIVTVSVASVILPRMSKCYNEEKNTKGILEIWSDSCKKTAMIMFPIFWIAILFSTGYIQIIFSEKYVIESTPIFIIYLLKFPLYCTVYGNILIVMGRQKYIMYNSIVGVILNIILNTIFLAFFGMKGPAISTVMVQYIVVALQLIQISKCSGVKLNNVMPFKELGKIFVLPAVIAVPAFIISLIINIPSWVGLIIFGILIYGGSLIIYYKLNYIDKNIIKLIKK